MGWMGYHMNQFRKGMSTYYEPYYQCNTEMEGFGNDKVLHFNQEDYTIGQMLTKKGDHIIFEYDFGDSWDHEVTLSSVDEYKNGEPHQLVFLSGKRACPPEDCGGVWGYEELCSLWQKKQSGERLTREEKEQMDWLLSSKEEFDPEFLDLEECKYVVEELNDIE